MRSPLTAIVRRQGCWPQKQRFGRGFESHSRACLFTSPRAALGQDACRGALHAAATAKDGRCSSASDATSPIGRDGVATIGCNGAATRRGLVGHPRPLAPLPLPVSNGYVNIRHGPLLGAATSAGWAEARVLNVTDYGAFSQSSGKQREGRISSAPFRRMVFCFVDR